MPKRKKIYVFVDESGQDDASKFFVVVAVVSEDPTQLRDQLLDVENEAKTHHLKWHKTRHDRRMHYLSLILKRRILAGSVYLGQYKKPLPYFFPVLEIIEKALKQEQYKNQLAIVTVDGINKLVARSLTNALRTHGISLHMVKGKRDESEPLIRLADMWAGCMRLALLKEGDSKDLMQRAMKKDYFAEIIKT